MNIKSFLKKSRLICISYDAYIHIQNCNLLDIHNADYPVTIEIVARK